MQNFRTDLALEMRENIKGEIDGVELTTESDDEAVLTWVKITNENGANAMGKPVGNYITFESPTLKSPDPEAHEEIAKILAQKLGELHKLPAEAAILVIGLGNRQVTPDALGPQVCEKLLVTRHLSDEVPPDLAGKLRSVSAISPGVMGITGIETAEVILGISEKTRPDLIIAIDALASRKTSRVNATIQISDAGINPGAGLGNRRTPINRETMGIPVIAIGVPTVLDAATLVNDTMEKMLSEIAAHSPRNESFCNMLADLEDADRHALITEILAEQNMFVTPKDIDAVVSRLANIIANTLNIALHPGITTDDVNRYVNG